MLEEDPADFFEDALVHIENNSRLREEYQSHYAHIRTRFYRNRPIQDVYVFRVNSVDVMQLMEFIKLIFYEQESVFKINFAFGLFLEHIQTESIRFYHPSANVGVYFDMARLIEKRSDIIKLANDIRKESVEDVVFMRNRESTDWKFLQIACVTVFVTKLNHLTLGCPLASASIPREILKNRAIITFASNHKGVPFSDYLCLFRCVAAHDSKKKDLKNEVTALFCKFRKVVGCVAIDEFTGVRLSEISILASVASKNIDIYSLYGGKLRLICLSKTDFPDSVKVVMHDNHCMLLSNPGSIMKKFICEKCSSVFLSRDNLRRHQSSTCNVFKQKYSVKKFGWGRAHTVFTKLARLNITTPPYLKSDQYLIVYDFECFFEKRPNFTGLSLENAYSVPHPNIEYGLKASIRLKGVDLEKAVFSVLRYPQSPLRALVTLTGGASKRLGDGKPFVIINDAGVIQLLKNIYINVCHFHTHILFRIETIKTELLEDLIPLSVAITSNVPGFDSIKYFVSTGDRLVLVERFYLYLIDIAKAAFRLRLAKFRHIFKRIREASVLFKKKWVEQTRMELRQYIQRTAVIGFNSSRFDLRLIKRDIFLVFKRLSVTPQVVSKGDSPILIKTDWLLFLDQLRFMAGGCSLEMFIKAYCNQQSQPIKYPFCYEYMDGLEKLTETRLPPKDAFFSRLKQKGITDEEYQLVQRIWVDEKFSNIGDYLEFYNKSDVEYFLLAVIEYKRFWDNQHVDCFKQALSLPGLSVQFGFNRMTPGTTLHMVNKRNLDMYWLIRKNIIGGPAIVFQRFSEVGQTIINGKNIVRSICYYDSNSLYLGSMGKNMPSGPCLRYLPDGSEHFKQVTTERFGRMELEWLMFSEGEVRRRGLCDKHRLWHTYNGRQIRLSKKNYAVDGFCENCMIIHQFYGAYFHGRPCCRSLVNSISLEKLCVKWRETMRIELALTDLGFKVVSCCECEWLARKKDNTNGEGDFCKRIFYNPMSYRKRVSCAKLLELVANGTFFGMVLVDIETPDHLRDYFASFPPIFKKTKLKMKDLTLDMQRLGMAENKLSSNQEYLISSLFGEKILLSSPLLKFYLERGLVVSKVYEAMSFTAQPMFQNVTKEITTQRIEADLQSEKKVVANSSKLTANALYGKFLEGFDHKSVKIVTAEKALRLACKNNFNHVTELGNDLYEVRMNKKIKDLSQPVTAAFFILNYAKLFILRFVYEFFKDVCDQDAYIIHYTDTDSVVVSTTSPTGNLQDIVRPDARDRFEAIKPTFFPVSSAPEEVRRPLIFKVEKGPCDVWVGLNAKTYYLGSKEENEKSGSKGVAKSNTFRYRDYYNALFKQEVIMGTNMGFTKSPQGMGLALYRTRKVALSGFYAKRKVLPNRIDTIPLDL